MLPVDVSCVLCLDCGTLLRSYHVYHYVTCSCPNEATNDGGDSYGRYGAMDLARIVAGRLNLTTWQFKELQTWEK